VGSTDLAVDLGLRGTMRLITLPAISIDDLPAQLRSREQLEPRLAANLSLRYRLACRRDASARHWPRALSELTDWALDTSRRSFW
jgi:hypothetical protein